MQFTFTLFDLDMSIIAETESASRHFYCLTVRIVMTQFHITHLSSFSAPYIERGIF